MDAQHWDQRYATSDLIWSGEPNVFVREVLGDREPGRILDLACGEGRNAIWLAERGWQATGIDFSGVGIDKAAALADQRGVGVEWIRADATDPGLDERIAGRFDTVLLCYLHLTPAPMRAALRRALTAAAPGGRVLIIAHARDNLSHGVGGPQDPEVLMSAEEVATALGEIAAEMHLSSRIDRADQPTREVNTPEGSRQAIDLLVEMTVGVV